MSIVTFFSRTVSLPLNQRHGDLVLAHGLAEVLQGKALVGAALRQDGREGLQACSLVCHLELERGKTDDVGVGRKADLRRIGFEARVQVPRSCAQGGDDEDEDNYLSLIHISE